MSLGSGSVVYGADATLSFTLTNASPASQPLTLTGISFVDKLPGGLLTDGFGGPAPTCGGATVQASSDTISLTGATLQMKDSCTFSIQIYTNKATAVGLLTNQIAVTSNIAPVEATVTFTLQPPQPPNVTMTFDPPSISVGGTSKLTFDVENPFGRIGTLRGVSFTDVLPTGVVIATPPNESGACGSGGAFGGTPPSTPAGGNTIQAPKVDYDPKRGCQFSVYVTANAPGVYQNQITVTSNSSPVAASATLTVTTAPPPPVVKTSFSPALVMSGGDTALSFTITNDSLLSNPATLSGVSFAEQLPNNLMVGSGTVPQTCGGATVQATGNTISLTGATLGPRASCTFQVPIGVSFYAAVGPVTNQITVSSNANAKVPVTASATLTVLPPKPPQVTMSFDPANISVGGTSKLTFDVKSPQYGTGMIQNLQLTDVLPTGVLIATPPNESGVCESDGALGGAPPSTPAGGNTIQTAKGDYKPGEGCQFSVYVTASVPGVYQNQITVTSNTTPVTGTATLTVTAAPPPPVVKMSFTPTSIIAGGVTNLSFTITNASLSSITGINLVDQFPVGMGVNNFEGQICGGVPVQPQNGLSGTLSVTGATLGARQSCTFQVEIGVSPLAPLGALTNQSTVSSNANAKMPVTASATMTLLPPNPPQVTISFDPPNIAAGATSTLKFDVENPKHEIGTLQKLGFTDVLPAGVVIATPPNENGYCGWEGNFGNRPSTPAGGNTITTAKMDYGPGAACKFSVDVVGTAAGVYQNQITVTSNSTPVNASATLTVTSDVPPSKGTPTNAPAQTATVNPPPAQALPANAPAQTATVNTPPAQTVNLADDSTPGFFLDKCFCRDALRLKDRQQKLEGIKTLIATKLQSTPPNAPAKQQAWAALQAQINGYLQALIMQDLTTFPDKTLFNGNGDPFCGPQTISAGECLDQSYAQHQQVHDASCRAGNWNWQTSWTDVSMLQEEMVGLQLEINAIKETLKHLGCGGQSGGNSTSVAQTCPQFMVLVQNQTTSSFNAGGLNGGSGRSLNNGQGIPVPLAFNDDGTFQGFGSGTDAGSAAGTIPGESVRSQFGHSQSIAASGVVHPGSCSTKPCQPDVMHLVLVGGPSQQMTQGQARGEFNRNMQQTTQTGAARLEFDLPAYIGGSAQKTFFSTPILNSGMTVMLLQANNNTPALAQGSSLLYAMQQCKSGSTRAAGSGGATGIVIPGLEGVSSTPPNKSASGIQNNSGGAGIIIPGLEDNNPPKAGQLAPNKSAPGTGAGIIIPGLEGNNPPVSSSQSPVQIHIDETIHAADSTPLTPGLILQVNEAIKATDVFGPTNSTHVAVTVPENIQAIDGVEPQPGLTHAVVTVNENVQLNDGIPADENLPHQMATINETVTVTATPQP